MNKESLIQIKQIENIGIVSFNQISHSNPNISNLISEFRQDLHTLNLRNDLRVIIFQGFENVYSYPCPTKMLDSLTDISNFRMSDSIAEVELPSLAILNGNIFDQALELALATDIRIASDTAQFRMGQLLSGKIPWDGGSQRLPKIVGQGRALEITLTCRQINSEDALSIGLISRIINNLNLDTESINLAKQISHASPIAVKFFKESILTGLELHLNEGLKLEADLNFLLQHSFDRAEGIRSFVSRKKPRFRGE